MKMKIRRGDLVMLHIPEVWKDHEEWGRLALVLEVHGMMIKLFCDSGHTKEIPVQIHERYLELMSEGR